MDTDQTLRLSALTCAVRLSVAGHRHPTGPLCPGRSSSIGKRENGRRAASKLTREAKMAARDKLEYVLDTQKMT
jgi:hypothetical protein